MRLHYGLTLCGHRNDGESMLLCYSGQDMVHGISKTPGLDIMGATVRQEVFLVPEGKKESGVRKDG